MFRNIKQLIGGLIGVLVCVLGMWNAGRAGLSAALSDYGTRNRLPAPAAEAVRLSPLDPEARLSRASILLKVGRIADAINDLENAVTLRPGDYILWLELGHAREQSGDEEGALAAFKEASRLAPNYARPHWELGHLQLRAGRLDQAFAEFRLAAQSRPALLPEVINLA